MATSSPTVKQINVDVLKLIHEIVAWAEHASGGCKFGPAPIGSTITTTYVFPTAAISVVCGIGTAEVFLSNYTYTTPIRLSLEEVVCQANDENRARVQLRRCLEIFGRLQAMHLVHTGKELCRCASAWNGQDPDPE